MQLQGIQYTAVKVVTESEADGSGWGAIAMSGTRRCVTCAATACAHMSKLEIGPEAAAAAAQEQRASRLSHAALDEREAGQHPRPRWQLQGDQHLVPAAASIRGRRPRPRGHRRRCLLVLFVLFERAAVDLRYRLPTIWRIGGGMIGFCSCPCKLLSTVLTPRSALLPQVALLVKICCSRRLRRLRTTWQPHTARNATTLTGPTPR